ncbi:MAG: NAD(P)/FAD-dependent oxidoreductase [Kaiparowitsia implicata GSE-PSE-MK54-09C]|jgi:NADH dehydrogenase|nr:NAD(P)/FAD-dependent oxidoreductase [Kaiparowitsia implicata GSE-PSE-MK54-09C]
MTQHPTRICILGGGFGGLYTALRLSQLPWNRQEQPEITLVDQHDRFLFLPLLYELVTNELETWEIAPPFTELLAGTNIRFVQATVSGIDVEAKRVYLHNAPELSYDRLAIALGSDTPMAMAPGVEDHALSFHSIQDAYRLQERLRHLEASDAEKIRVAIVGAGYSGVELACKLADRLGGRGRIRLVELGDKILRNSTDFNREAAQKALEKQGIWVDLETKVASVQADSLSLDYKGSVDTIPVDIVMWTVGTQVSEVVKHLPLPKTPQERLLLLPTLQVEQHPDVFALGDSAKCVDADGQMVPTTAQAAFQQADYAGWNIWASLTGRPLLPFRYRALGEMMALGTDNATLSGLGLKLDGPLAYVTRRLAYLYRMPTFEHQLKVGLNWVTRPLRDLLTTPN